MVKHIFLGRGRSINLNSMHLPNLHIGSHLANQIDNLYSKHGHLLTNGEGIKTLNKSHKGKRVVLPIGCGIKKHIKPLTFKF